MNREFPARCFLCLEQRELTDEHLIPQAFGGRVKAKIYCHQCNANLGYTIDAELVSTFAHLATLLQLERERGRNQPYEVKDMRRGIELLHDGKTLSRKRPIVNIIKKGDNIEMVDITARSKGELDNIRKSVTAKYGIVEPGKTFEERHPGPIDTTYERRIDTRQIRRAVTKMAYGYLCTRIPQAQIFTPKFDRTRDFVKNDKGDDLASANFIHTRWMCDYVRPLHRIHISLNRSEKIITACVMLFGIYRFTILLSDNYESYLEWSDLDYTFDPVLGRRIYGKDEFRAPRLHKTNILHPRQSKEFVRQEVVRCHKLLERYVAGWVFLDMELN